MLFPLALHSRQHPSIRKWAAKKVDLVDAAHEKRTPTAAKMLLLVLMSTQNLDRAGPHGTAQNLSELAADSIWATWNLFFESPQTLVIQIVSKCSQKR